MRPRYAMLQVDNELLDFIREAVNLEAHLRGVNPNDPTYSACRKMLSYLREEVGTAVVYQLHALTY